MAAPLLGLRVDVDTHQGMREGVPRLLGVLAEELSDIAKIVTREQAQETSTRN